MKRVVILGPGAAGKSTLAAQLGEITGLPVVELDQLFCQPGLRAISREQWRTTQRELVEQNNWILDGDLGRYDGVEIRLQATDTGILLDFPLTLCAWRAIRRSRERLDLALAVPISSPEPTVSDESDRSTRFQGGRPFAAQFQGSR